MALFLYKHRTADLRDTDFIIKRWWCNTAVLASSGIHGNSHNDDLPPVYIAAALGKHVM